MYEDLQTALEAVNRLVDEYRVRCLWYLRNDYYPDTVDAAIQVLLAIEKNGDLAAFKKAAPLRQWLSHQSSAASAS